MFLQSDHARLVPLARLPTIDNQFMQLGVQWLESVMGNDAIVMRERDVPRRLQAAQVAGRYRQWLIQKLATGDDPLRRSGCVGNARCITWCPVGINLTNKVVTLTAGGQP